jgi:hypothetical protein
MYFWHIEQLKDELATSPLSERESFNYLMAYVVLTTLPFWPSESEVNYWDHLIQASSLLFSVLGTIHAYRENGGAAGQQFLQRYLALGWVWAIRWGVWFAFAGVLTLSLREFAFGVDDSTSAFDFAFWLVAYPVYWWQLGIHIRSVANRITPPVAQT